MKCVLFYHAFTSCWNNGNAHFLRGIARELDALGHDVVVYEPADGWSRLNALRDGGEQAFQEVTALLPGIDIRQYQPGFDFEAALDDAGLVIVHEWNPPELVKAIGRHRVLSGEYTLLFHDTHHRAITAPQELARFDLSGFDGVLAFGEVLREIYLKLGWANRAFTWHEAADTSLYRPMPHIWRRNDVVWIGNWGDGERAAELIEFLIAPVSQLGLHGEIHGVRYSSAALRVIEAAGIDYCGWLPAHRAPAAFAAARATVHVPRGPYVQALPGIPTIRMFEALACGIPIVSAPWSDVENLFPEGTYLRAADGDQMQTALNRLRRDPELASATAKAGLDAIAERHTCRHRVLQLLDIVDHVRGSRRQTARPRQEGALA
ncbi:glycosyltransferase [Bradyrhizobium sp. WSM 1704]|uniref:CgeB family protein n=1 Tax=Bradyrhizobium semiaridum TaxID=2821404 RepID=UPI001CE276BA|nr:glycosyltransferase [Bradyrhizobium semiaridum]MCA6125196.1 glycosyltransferase [Bradyrhizobium semiaridum]